MAQVNIEEIIDHLKVEMRKALVAALAEVAPGAQVEPRQFFRAFRRAVGRKCATWESVPDGLVQVD